MQRTFFIRTFGCQMNEHDSEAIAASLSSEGYARVEDHERADVVVLNTCCIRENADTKLYGHLGHLKSLKDRRPDLQIAVGGCLAQRDGEELLARAPHVDVVFGTHNVGRAGSLLRDAHRRGTSVVEVLDAPEEDPFPSALYVRPELPYAAWVTVQVGCDNSCAFCIVPRVRGPEQSRGFVELVEEVRALASGGTSEVTLLGQNVNSYGRDLTLGSRGLDAEPAARRCGPAWVTGDRRVRPLFGDLLRAIGEIPGIRRIRFTSPHPKDLRPETIAAMADSGAVCEHLHLPLQSGSDRVLAAMHRGYTVERYLERLARARAEITDLAVTTDLIVGFPGETDAEFDETLAVVAEIGYDSAYTFIFSPRPGTAAAEMADAFVPPEVAGERLVRLKEVVDRSAARRHAARVGRVEEAVVEGPSKHDPSVLAGRTRQGKVVHFPEGDGLTPGRYLSVRVTGAGAHHLAGDVVAVEPVSGLARRRRLNVPILSG